MIGHFHSRSRQCGFTMVELITVIILVGILGAIGVSRYFDRTGFEADGFASQAKTMLRYAQKVAVAQNGRVFVRLDGAGIALFACYPAGASCAAPPMLPAPHGANSGTSKTTSYCGSSTTMCEALPPGITYSTSPAGVAYFHFDAQGRPFAQADTDDHQPSSFVPFALNISAGGVTRSVNVAPETGYVY